MRAASRNTATDCGPMWSPASNTSASSPLPGPLTATSSASPTARSRSASPGSSAWDRATAASAMDYCSSVCCMYATKQAMITKEHEHDIETTIFYIDMRAQGKGFDRFYERARDETGVRYVRSMVSRVVPVPETDTLAAHLFDAEQRHPRRRIRHGGPLHRSVPASVLRRNWLSGWVCKLDAHGFCATDPLDLVATSQTRRFRVRRCAGSQGHPRHGPAGKQRRRPVPRHCWRMLAARSLRRPRSIRNVTSRGRNRASGCLSAIAASTSPAW